MDEICTTSINISLDTISDPACGEVSHNVTISGSVVYPYDDSKYFINGLQSDTLHNVTVTLAYNYGGFRIFNRSVRTSLPKCKYQIHNLPSKNYYSCMCTLFSRLIYIIIFVTISYILVAPNPINTTSIIIEKTTRNSLIALVSVLL